MLHPLLHTHALQVVSPDPVGGVGWHWESGRNSEGKNVLKLPVYPRDPRSTQRAIHHICISICKLTSHTHGTLNKLHSEWKHAPHWSLMCTLCVHTRPHCLPQPSRCACSLFFLDYHVQGSTSTMLPNHALSSTVTSMVFPCLAFSSLNTGR